VLARAQLVFGLNALYGRNRTGWYTFEGDWNPSNARAFLDYNIRAGYSLLGVELGEFRRKWRDGDCISGTIENVLLAAHRLAFGRQNLRGLPRSQSHALVMQVLQFLWD
jgi:hypothetical protein